MGVLVGLSKEKQLLDMKGFTLWTIFTLTLVSLCLGDCDWKEKKRTVKEGEAVRFIKKFKKVKVCEDGKLKYKKIAETDFTIACNGCGWLTRFCVMERPYKTFTDGG